jgi:hypothetical protein
MQLPQLFGSDFVLPVILVVVVLLAILGLLALRSRAKQRSAGAPGQQPVKMSRADKAAAKAAMKPEKSTREGRKATALAAKAQRDSEELDAAAGEPVPGQEPVPGIPDSVMAAAAAAAGAAPIPAQPAPAAPSAPARRVGREKAPKPAQVDASPMANMTVDPLQKVIANILAGWGDITTEDTNRLAIFRRDRVVAALTAIETPKEGKGNDYARTRLTQLRRFANNMGQNERPAPVEPEVHEFAGIAAPAATEDFPMAAPTGAMAGAAAATPASGSAAPGRRSWYAAESEPAPPIAAVPEAQVAQAPAATPEWSPIPGEEIEEVEVSAGNERAAEFDWGTTEEDLATTREQLKAVDLTWNHEPTPVAAPPAPEPPVEEARVTTVGTGDEASRNAEAAVAAAAAAFWGSEDAPRLERSVGDLGKAVGNAADVMALPANERADVLAFLDPGELTRVFSLADTTELKKSVIDTLEHIGNTASLDAIHLCLDDSDPEIQLYALDAADRMLGKDS